ncbi:hypothetical protein EBZ80_05060 [bacterium]|nr:hypothetical protein [bacterium]
MILYTGRLRSCTAILLVSFGTAGFVYVLVEKDRFTPEQFREYLLLSTLLGPLMIGFGLVSCCIVYASWKKQPAAIDLTDPLV